MKRYLVISPVKDEEMYMEATLVSVVNQTLRPVCWVIVDDGSNDGSGRLARNYALKHDWIRIVHLTRERDRQPGSAVIRAFQVGREIVKDEQFDFIVKLDCDLELPRDYFERLLNCFEDDPKLGIASGVYLEKRKGHWTAISMPAYHAAGASKVVRRECFQQIGGFVAARGWDTVDEIRAQTIGWRTAHFPGIQFFHLKKEGSGIGDAHTNIMHGEIYYLTGGGLLFFVIKLIHRLFLGRPLGIAAILVLYGYLKALASRKPLLVNEAEARHYRSMLRARILNA